MPLSAIANPEWQSMIRLGVYIGQRLSDLAKLTWDQIDLENGVIRLIDQKTGGSPAIRIGAACREHILSLPAMDPEEIHPYAFRIFSARQNCAPLSEQFRTPCRLRPDSANLVVATPLQAERSQAAAGRTGAR